MAGLGLSCTPLVSPLEMPSHPHSSCGESLGVMPRRARRPPRGFPACPRAPAVTRVPPPPTPRPSRPLPLAAAARLPAPHRDVSAVRRRRAGRSRRCSAAGPGAGAVGKGGPGRGRRAHARRSCPRGTLSGGGGAAHHPRHAAPLPRVSRPAPLCRLAGAGNGGGDPPGHLRACLEPSRCLPAPHPPHGRASGGSQHVPPLGQSTPKLLRRHSLFPSPRDDNHRPVAPCHPRVSMPSQDADNLSPLVSQVGVSGPTGHHAAGAGWAQLEEEDRGYSADL